MYKRNHHHFLPEMLRQSKHFLIFAVLFIFCLNCPSGLTADEDSSVLVITNGASQMNSITESNLRSIFAMRNNHWGKEVDVEVFVLPDDHPTHVSFAKYILHTFPYNLRRIWDRKVYSGTGQLPTVVNTEEEMIDKVSSTPNAIGYITKRYYRESAKVVELIR